MARAETWQRLRYFDHASGVDNWGDPGAIADELLLRLDDFRHWLGVPVIVTAGVKVTGHASKSFHYVANGACAVDIVIPDYHNCMADLVLDASRFGFTGIGLYPDWQYRGEVIGGLHLDTRPLKWDSDDTRNYNQSRWMGLRGDDGKQYYTNLDFANLRANGCLAE
jgi:hypothetical protein